MTDAHKLFVVNQKLAVVYERLVVFVICLNDMWIIQCLARYCSLNCYLDMNFSACVAVCSNIIHTKLIDLVILSFQNCHYVDYFALLA